jgi:hypothetical protein
VALYAFADGMAVPVFLPGHPGMRKIRNRKESRFFIDLIPP